MPCSGWTFDVRSMSRTCKYLLPLKARWCKGWWCRGRPQGGCRCRCRATCWETIQETRSAMQRWEDRAFSDLVDPCTPFWSVQAWARFQHELLILLHPMQQKSQFLSWCRDIRPFAWEVIQVASVRVADIGFECWRQASFRRWGVYRCECAPQQGHKSAQVNNQFRDVVASWTAHGLQLWKQKGNLGVCDMLYHFVSFRLVCYDVRWCKMM